MDTSALRREFAIGAWNIENLGQRPEGWRSISN